MEPNAARTPVRSLRLLSLPAMAALLLLGGCATTPPLAATRNQIIISVKDQKLTLVKEDHTRESFPISTSKFGLGDRSRSYETPTGELAVAAKIGAGAKSGTVFHGRVSTGEVVAIDAPGRDAIVTRILALKGLETGNQQAFSRGIYIHGTPEERNIGRPTSYGCIRMRSRDVITLFDAVKVGARVQIIDSTQNQAIASNILTSPPDSPAAANPAAALASAEAAATGSPPSVVTTTTSTAPVVPGAANVVTKITATTTPAAPGAAVVTKTTVTTAPAAVAAAPKPAAKTGAKAEWAGAPSQMLAKQAANDARAKQNARPPVGAPAGTQPVSNDNAANEEAARRLRRSGIDSL